MRKIDADKYLWTKEKIILFHIKFLMKFSKRDKIILFEGNYEEINRLNRFQSLIVSPNVKINKFKLFKSFYFFLF